LTGLKRTHTDHPTKSIHPVESDPTQLPKPVVNGVGFVFRTSVPKAAANPPIPVPHRHTAVALAWLASQPSISVGADPKPAATKLTAPAHPNGSQVATHHAASVLRSAKPPAGSGCGSPPPDPDPPQLAAGRRRRRRRRG